MHAASHTSDFFWSMCPPHIAIVAAGISQDALVRARARVLAPLDLLVPDSHILAHQRVELLFQLPTRMGGCGMMDQRVLAPASFLATLDTVLNDPLVASLKDFLRPMAEEAYTIFHNLFGGMEHSLIVSMTKGFPTDASQLLDLRTCDSLKPPSTRKRMQSRLTTAVNTQRRDCLRASCDTDTHPPGPGRSLTSMTHTDLLTRRSQQTRTLQAPLCYKENRISAKPFIYFMRYLMGLPRLIRPGRPTMPRPAVPPEHLVQHEGSTIGFVAEVCALNHGCQCLLLEDGAHEISCPSTFGARYGAHGRITRVLARAAIEVGASVKYEPPTREILLNQFAEEECKSLCPKVSSVATRDRATVISLLLHKMATVTRNSSESRDTLEKLGVALRSLPGETKGVRLDLEISLTDGRVVWCDFTGIHPTTTSVLARLRAFLRLNGIVDDVAAGVVANSSTARLPSPAVVEATKLKRLRYHTLVELAANQVASRRRTVLPILVPGVVTHSGELGPDLIGLIEMLTMVAGKGFKKGWQSRGLSRSRFTAIFRTKVKDALMAANAEGFGQALVAAGNPISGWVTMPEDMVGAPGMDLAGWDVNY
jgi:hypothetical protein